jgi:hypothetical protein
VRYYRWYSHPGQEGVQKDQGLRRPIETDATGRLGYDPDTPDSKYIKAARTTFAPLIKKVHEVGPLVGPTLVARCGTCL